MLVVMGGSLTGLEDAPASAVYESFSSILGGGGAAAEARGRDEPRSWNLDAVVDVLRADHRALDWTAVARSLDHPGSNLVDTAAFAFVVAAIRACSGAPFPTASLLEPWTNTVAQFFALRHAVTAPPEELTFASLPASRMIAPMERGSDGGLNACWFSLDLYTQLVALSHRSGIDVECRAVFQRAEANAPELLLLGLANARVEVGFDIVGRPSVAADMYTRAVEKVIGPVLWPSGAAPSALQRGVLLRLFDLNPIMLVQALEVAHSVHGKTLTLRRLTALHQIMLLRDTGGSVTPAFSSTNFQWALEIAVFASGEALSEADPVSVASYVGNGLVLHRDAFAAAVADYIYGVVSAQSADSSCVLLPVDTLGKLFKVLRTHLPMLSADTQNRMQQVYEVCNAAYPALTNDNHEVEEEANAIFQRIYMGQQSIPDVIEMLQRFKNSESQRERDIFACMIHNLFDEYRFFSRYPDKELKITGVLFGSLIQHQLVTSSTLGIALRYILEALRKAPNTSPGNKKMFFFGVYALEQFNSRLVKWPQYCGHIAAIPHLREIAPAIVDEIARIASGGGLSAVEPSMEPGAGPAVSSNPQELAKPSGAQRFLAEETSTGYGESGDDASSRSSGMVPLIPPVVTAGSGGGAEAAHADEAFSAPPPDVSDRVHFIINNVTDKNAEDKGSEVVALLEPQWYTWFAMYLLTKRVVSQLNFHSVYLRMILGPKRPELEREVLRCTYIVVRRYLTSDKIKTIAGERSMLKNLGSWLGRFTLARDRPILHRDIDLKELLYSAYEAGRLIACVAFVAKILEACKDSRVFAPPNPWVMGLMGALKDLYDLQDLKLNLKFEVEVLCKHFALDVKDLRPGEGLARRARPDLRDNPDFNVKHGHGHEESSKHSEPARAAAAPASSGPVAAPVSAAAATSGAATSAGGPTSDGVSFVVPNLAS